MGRPRIVRGQRPGDRGHGPERSRICRRVSAIGEGNLGQRSPLPGQGANHPGRFPNIRDMAPNRPGVRQLSPVVRQGELPRVPNLFVIRQDESFGRWNLAVIGPVSRSASGRRSR